MREVLDSYADVLEAGGRLSIHLDSVRRLIRQAKIPASRFANKWLIRKDQLEQITPAYDSRPGKKAPLFWAEATGTVDLYLRPKEIDGMEETD